MSGAQALLSIPVSQSQVPSRDVGGDVQDAASAEAAGSAFEQALGAVDGRKSPSGSAESRGDDANEVSTDEEATQSSSSGPGAGALAAALAALGATWVATQSQSTGSDGATASQPQAETDPLTLLARALAANDTEAEGGDAPSVIDEFVDVRILGRERHLAIDVAASGERLVDTSAIAADAAATDAAVAQSTSNAVDAAQALQRASTVPEAASQQAAVGVAQAAKQDSGRTTNSADAGSDTRKTSNEDLDVGADPSLTVANLKDQRLTAAKAQRDAMNLDRSSAGIAASADDGKTDADPNSDLEFSMVLQKPADGATPAVKLMNADNSAALMSPADQISTQLQSQQARDVISTVRTSGDTKVMEIELKPDNLGAVTVRVTLKNDVISLKLEAQRADTAQDLAREADKLANTLKQAGYVVDDITTMQMDLRTVTRLEAASSSTSSGSNSQGQSQSSPQQGQSFQGNGSGSQQNGQGRAYSGSSESWPGGSNKDGQNSGLASGRETGLYV